MKSSGGSPHGMARHALQSLVRPEQWFLGTKKESKLLVCDPGRSSCSEQFSDWKTVVFGGSGCCVRDGVVGGAECVGRASQQPND